MSSFGHKIVSATQCDRDHYNNPRQGSAGVTWPAIGCGGPKCGKPIAYVASYRYVTGRAGRVSTSEKFLCEDHGRKFAAKNNLDAPDPTAPGTAKSVTQGRSEFITRALGG